MLAACLEVPADDNAWQVWAFNSKMAIDSIRQTIQAKYGVKLVEYVLIPFTQNDAWLTNNSTAHNDFNNVLGLQSHDIEDLDFTNQDEVASWVNLAYNELYDASAALGI